MDPYPSRCLEQVVEPRHASAWQIIKSYWQSQHRFPAYLFFTIVMAMTVSLVGLNIFFTYWYYYFYEVMQSYDKHGAVRLFVFVMTLTAFYLMWAAYRFYVSHFFRTRGRQWFKAHFIQPCLERRGYNYTGQGDVDSLVNFSIDLSMGLIGAITTFLVLLYTLWQLLEELDLSLVNANTLFLTGYVTCLGVMCLVLVTFCTYKMRQSLALFKSGSHHDNMAGKMRSKSLLWLKVGCYQLTLVLPLMVVLPDFFYKVILLSWLLQSLQSFSRVQGSLSSVVRSYSIVPHGNTADI
jgi:ABC-type uncharacterized transport system fused permease/ATPase subunit